MNTHPRTTRSRRSKTRRASRSEGAAARHDEFDAESAFDRFVDEHSTALSLFGLALGLLGRRRWLLLPLALQACAMRSILQGRRPMPALLRRLGLRTAHELEEARGEPELRRRLVGAPAHSRTGRSSNGA